MAHKAERIMETSCAEGKGPFISGYYTFSVLFPILNIHPGIFFIGNSIDFVNKSIFFISFKFSLQDQKELHLFQMKEQSLCVSWIIPWFWNCLTTNGSLTGSTALRQ